MKKAPKYKSVMDDPHYDPPDPYHRAYASERSTRTQSGGMTVENREAMMKIFFSGIVSPSPLASGKNMSDSTPISQDNVPVVVGIAEDFKICGEF